MRGEFILAIKANQTAFDLELEDTAVDRLADYYDLILEHNSLLHLVGPCSPAEFAVRHILESLTLLEHLPPGARLADVGAGAGLPSIPCLVVREDIAAKLIESKERKSRFLETAIDKLGISNRTAIINRQFDENEPGDAGFITCRALDKFSEKLPRLIKWSGKRNLLLFGGPALGLALSEQKKIRRVTKRLIPMSEQRFLYVALAP